MAADLKITVDRNTFLALRKERDASVMFNLIEKDRRYLKEWLPWLDTSKTVENSLNHIKATRAQFESRKSLTLGIWHRKQLCGVAGFHTLDWANSCGKIGYWLGADYQGKGIMVNSCKKLVEYGFNKLKLNRIEIMCATKNKKSRAIPERLGFELEGVSRQAEFLYDHFVDVAIYGMTKDRWRKPSK